MNGSKNAKMFRVPRVQWLSRGPNQNASSAALKETQTMNRSSLRCLLTILLIIQTAALKFGIPTRLFSQIKTPKSITPTEVQRNLEPITVDNSRNLMDITDLNFKENVLDQEGLTIVLFTSSWCTPCRSMQKNLGEIMGNYTQKSKFCSIDTDHNPESAAEFQVRSIPSTLFFKHGKLVSEIVGSVPQTVVISQITKHTA